MLDKVTAPRIRAMKARGEKVVCVTAYDASMGKLADEAGVDLILVGDSVGDVVLGYSSTIPVTLEEMLHHTRAVRRGVHRALLVADLPFGSYQPSVEVAMESAVALMKAGAEAVKVEGANPAIAEMVRAGIPVMGHVGLTPQSVFQFGGHKVQGKGEDADHVLRAAQNVEEQGVFSIVLELIPATLAARITKCLDIPTIGIGAGLNCDGQIQVLHDVLGLSERTFKHAKPYVDSRGAVLKALQDYSAEVRSGAFPEERHSF
jgi:3-methyl-2-oxobutanoate hydroxymethyltransferase